MKLILWACALILGQSAIAAPVTIKFTNTAYRSGKIAVAVYKDAQGFPNSGSILQTLVPVTSSQNSVETTIDLPEGNYALAFFLDENGNNKLDKNMLGIPKERFGFSNNPRILTGPPNYAECEIDVTNGSNVFSMKLIKLF